MGTEKTRELLTTNYITTFLSEGVEHYMATKKVLESDGGKIIKIKGVANKGYDEKDGDKTRLVSSD